MPFGEYEEYGEDKIEGAGEEEEEDEDHAGDDRAVIVAFELYLSDLPITLAWVGLATLKRSFRLLLLLVPPMTLVILGVTCVLAVEMLLLLPQGLL